MFLKCLLVRLIGGSSKAEGRVEVRHTDTGSWGTICDDNWDIHDANVICKMLDFDRAMDARGSAFFGPGSGKIVLDDVRCLGNETDIWDCPHNGIRNHNCDHNEDASAICQSAGACSTLQIR